MFNGAIASSTDLLAGAATGLVFGFLLQRAHVTRFQTIVGQFLLKDFTVLKVMLTAIVVGAIGIYGMRALGMEIAPQIKTAALLGNALGGAIFAVGMVIAGYCPGTGAAAIGDGSRHAIPALLGMVAGGAIYAEIYPFFNKHVLKAVDFGKVTLADVSGLSPWVFIAALAAIAVVVFILLERASPSCKSPAASA